jgi:hypothetical protein
MLVARMIGSKVPSVVPLNVEAAGRTFALNQGEHDIVPLVAATRNLLI